jgi:DeoR/GlpR family transcriptional regulator of sugar metabolism
VTNAANIWMALLPSQDCEITLLGGQLRGRNLAIVGVSAIQMIKMYGPTKAFIGVNAVDLERGVVCTPSPLEAAVQQAAIEVSQTVIVLADHTKFGHQSFAVTAALEDIDTLVTDRETSQRDTDRLAERGVRVMRA